MIFSNLYAQRIGSFTAPGNVELRGFYLEKKQTLRLVNPHSHGNKEDYRKTSIDKKNQLETGQIPSGKRRFRPNQSVFISLCTILANP
jgi:hypothetical protein